MKGHTKSAGVQVAQPNLFYMWNIDRNTVRDESSVDPTEGEALKPSRSSDVAALSSMEGVSAACRPLSLSHGSNTQLHSPLLEERSSKDVVDGRTLSTRRSGMSRKGKEIEQLGDDALDSQNPPSDSGICHDELSGLQPQMSRRTRRAPMKGKRKERATVELSQSALFSIFGRKAPTIQGIDLESNEGAKYDRTRITENTGDSLTGTDERNTDVCSGIPLHQSIKTSGLNEANASFMDQKLAEPSYEAGGSQEKPIVIDSSPVRGSTKRVESESESESEASSSPVEACRSVRPEAPSGFFVPRQRVSAPASSKSRKKFGEGDVGSWPDKDSLHVRGVQRPFPRTTLLFIRSCPEPCGADPSMSLAESIGYLRIHATSSPHYEPKYLVEPIGLHPDGHMTCERILQSNASCPAISRLLTADYDISGSSWNERWRPRCAAEVIGNEESAEYLKEWLLALEIKSDGHAPGPANGLPLGNFTDVSRPAKRPQIVRAVEKPRKRRKAIDSDEESIEDWITDDDEEEEATRPPCLAGSVEGESIDDEGGSPWKPKLTRIRRGRSPVDGISDMRKDDDISSRGSPHKVDRLTNTILLTGPLGSGKTAAVYACAEELGWEVFEVYPGIGKRNGANLLSLVGDVGKNHIVNRSSSKAIANAKGRKPQDLSVARQTSAENQEDRNKVIPAAFASFLKPGSKATSNTARESVRDEKTSVRSWQRESPFTAMKIDTRTSADTSDGNGRESSPSEDRASRQADAFQSIILLEEVDILYSEDANFWPTVVALIRESRRPVIMTCNDPGLVPFADLPLQKTLRFTPCPPALAIPYLQCLTLMEGYMASEVLLRALYEQDCPPDAIDISDTLVRSPVVPLSSLDLRRAINSLQFLCQGSAGFEDAGATIKTECDGRHPRVQKFDSKQYEPQSRDSSDRLLVGPSSSLQQEGLLRGDARDIDRLWQISDAFSMIDSDLRRSPSAVLEVVSLPSGPISDSEVGYRRLKYEPDVLHLQDGIAIYNYDEAIATEARTCARRAIGDDADDFGSGFITNTRSEQRWKPSFEEFIPRPRQSQHFARVSGVLEKIVEITARESVRALILDYEPWVRSIDRSDMLLEVAATKEAESRTVVYGGRTTRNSQRTQYQRYFDLDEDQRATLQSATLFFHHTTKVLCSGSARVLPSEEPDAARRPNTRFDSLPPSRRTRSSSLCATASTPTSTRTRPFYSDSPILHSGFPQPIAGAEVMDHPIDASGGISSRRHSPAPPLAPLEFLQSQRRGSLTDPSLHVGPTPACNGNASSSSFRPHDLLPLPASKQSESRSRNVPPPLAARPSSPYIFGDASSHSKTLSNRPSRAHLSENLEGRGNRDEKERAEDSQQGANRARDEMDIDSSGNRGDTSIRDDQRLPPSFDYNMRRHSVPGGSQLGMGHPRGGITSPSQAGAKRKMSTDRAQLPVVGEEIDPKLTGPGIHNRPNADPDEPAPKRRNSTFDTQRMAQMSLYDRRDSLDSRMSSGTPTSTWWSNDRRDSSSSMFSGTSMGSSAGFNSPGYAGDMHGRQPGGMSAFAWPSNSNAGPNDASPPQGMQVASPLDSNLNRPYETPVPPHTLVPSNSMPVDRRMSAPDAMALNASSRAERSLRSRSRPPSRSAVAGSRADEASPTSPDLSPASGRLAESPTSSSSQNHAPGSGKEFNATPYSRSPELRISHKLAERKRRKEMRDLFDELREQLPADRGMKASKWEILTKAIDYIQQLKQTQTDMSREIDLLRHEVESVRHGVPYPHHPGAPHPVMYPPPAAHYGAPQPPPHSLPPQSLSRPGSSHNSYTPGAGTASATNGKAQS